MGGRSDRDGLFLARGERPVRLRHFLHQGGDVDRLAPDGDVKGIGHRVSHQIVDHFGEPVGRVADIGDLHFRVIAERAGRGGYLFQYFGSAEDHSERVFQIMRDRAEDLALECVRLSQPRPLGGKSAIGVRQLLRARSNALLEPCVRPLQLLIQDDVIEGDG